MAKAFPSVNPLLRMSKKKQSIETADIIKNFELDFPHRFGTSYYPYFASATGINFKYKNQHCNISVHKVNYYRVRLKSKQPHRQWRPMRSNNKNSFLIKCVFDGKTDEFIFINSFTGLKKKALHFYKKRLKNLLDGVIAPRTITTYLSTYSNKNELHRIALFLQHDQLI